ncbi:MAG: hypothetical protein AAF416_01320 [Pseudomonadota bacterium]
MTKTFTAAALAAPIAALLLSAPDARADTYCSYEIFLGQQGPSCERKLRNRADRAGFRHRAGADRTLVFTRGGAVFFHCTGRNQAIVFAHHRRNRNACEMIDRITRAMRIGRR